MAVTLQPVLVEGEALYVSDFSTALPCYSLCRKDANTAAQWYPPSVRPSLFTFHASLVIDNAYLGTDTISMFALVLVVVCI